MDHGELAAILNKSQRRVELWRRDTAVYDNTCDNKVKVASRVLIAPLVHSKGLAYVRDARYDVSGC